MEFSNQLNKAEVERLALLLEELGEAQQVIGKILRHGYESAHPDSLHITNRDLLMTELGDVFAAVDIMVHADDLSKQYMHITKKEKIKKVGKYIHHNHHILGDLV